MKVEIWSDVVCPWCYIGKRRFEGALERFAHRDQVEVVWRSFELDPKAPAERTGDMASMLAAKYGRTRAQAQSMIDQVTATAAKDGLKYDLASARSGNTFDAHRVLHLAAEQHVQNAAKERLMAAYFTEGRAIGDRATLVSLAAEVGLDAEETRKMLASDRFTAEVRNDERDAARLGVQGVPFFVMDRKFGVSGAQPVEVLLEALDQAWSDAAKGADVPAGDAGACEDDNCAV